MSDSEQMRHSEAPLEQLRLDPKNPRLPEGLADATQGELRDAILANYDPLDIARSITEHGYFLSEPLIVVSEGDDTYTVVEGNRRLVALQILSDPSLAADSEEFEEWESLATDVVLPEQIPVVIAPSRDAVAPILGYRHISGIEPWDSYAKSRYIAGLVDGGQPFQEVARVVGETWNNIVSLYRNYAILKQARDEFGLDTSRAVNYFGVFTRAMSTRLRQYIGAPVATDVTPGQNPLPPEAGPRVAATLSWLFGDDEQPAVIGESRDLTKLGQVATSEEGRLALEATRDLEVAYEAAGGYLQRLIQRLTSAWSQLSAAVNDFGEYGDDPQVQALVNECRAALDRLEAV